MSRSTEFSRGGSSDASPFDRTRAMAGAGTESMPHERVVEARSGETPDWAKIGWTGAGFTIGMILGLGIALILAPRSGEETRELLSHNARRLGGTLADRWDDVQDDLQRAARRSRRKVRRGVTRGRWRVEDMWPGR